MRNKKSSAASLLLAGAAAFAYYKYSKMSPDERKDLVSSLKQKGRDILNKYMPGSSPAGMDTRTSTAPTERFGENSGYTA